MENTTPPPKKPPLPKPSHASYLKHRKDFAWKIVFPLVLATLLIMVISVLIGIRAFSGGQSDVALWAAISTIWIVIPLMMMALVVLALLFGLVYGLARLLGETPHYTGLAQHYIIWFNAQLRLWADKLSDPVVFIKTWGSVLLRNKK